MAPSPSRPMIASPAGLTACTFESGEQHFAILEWPVPRVGTGLPPAQSETLDLLLAGLSNAEIARRRGRSIHTVAHQVDRIFRRLGVGSRSELFALAARGAGLECAP